MDQVTPSPRSQASKYARRPFEFRDVDVVLAVAEAGSLRAAARMLDLEPSAVSRRLRAFEDRLGTSLFERSRSGVRLTNAGHFFRDEARSAIARLDDAVRSAGEAGRGTAGALSVGLIGSLSSRFLSQLLQRFRAAHSRIVLTMSEGNQRDHLAAIADRSIDVAFVLGVPQSVPCDAERLWTESIVAALSSNDARAAQVRLPVQALAADHFIVSAEPPGPDVHDYIIRALSTPSRRLSISRHRVGREALMMLVGLGFGTSLACGSEMRISYPNVTFVPLDGQEVSFSAVWSPQNDNPALRRFLSWARRLSREEERAASAARTPDPSP